MCTVASVVVRTSKKEKEKKGKQKTKNKKRSGGDGIVPRL